MAKKEAKQPEKSEAESPAGKKPSMKLVILIAIAMSLVGVGAGFALSFYTFSSAPKADEEAASAQTADGTGNKEDPAHEKASGEAGAKKSDEAKAGSGDKPGHGEDAGEKADHGSAEPETGKASEAASSDHGADAASDGHGEATAAGHGEAGDAAHAGPSTIALDPVVTNISKPSDVWVRLEAVLQTSQPLPPDLPDLIHQDFMAFFHTLRLEDLEGGSSYNDLKAELLARANTRAEGQVNSIFFKTFLFE